MMGENPISVYIDIIKGSIFRGLFQGDLSRLGDTLLRITTLILTGLAVAFAFKTGLFNIGVSGQMLFGGFLAVFVGVQLHTLPKPLLMTICILVAILGGALWALVPGILKASYRINEVVVCIMMNYCAVWIVHYLVRTNILSNFDTESKRVGYNASLRVDWMSKIFDGSVVNLSLFLAIICAILVWYILERTTFGYELKAVGFNHNAAKYAGMKVNKNILLSFVISGGIAGLAGASYYIGFVDHIQIGVLPTLGFDGIAVSLLGLNTPFGVLLSAGLFGLLRNGGDYINALYNMPKQFVDILVSLIIYFAAASLLIRSFLHKLSKRYRNQSIELEKEVK
ncbi:ABC transporter permease [Mycoplasmatota bacterium]|nr:ABC transporter permease [Mycoplasmatota bacterium]